MAEAVLAGALAGYAIAIPVGAIAVLIIETGLRRGFRPAAAAAAGAASADGIYATVAMLAGAAVARLIEPVDDAFRIAAAAVLLGLGLRGLGGLVRERGSGGQGGGPAAGAGFGTTYARFLGLTLLNPMTVVYFGALVVGLPELATGPAERGAFVAGAFLASLSWQLLLASLGAIGHRRLPRRSQAVLGLIGNLVIIAMALGIALRPG